MNEEYRKLAKYFIALFLISFFIINFNEIVLYTNKKLVEYELSKVAKKTVFIAKKEKNKRDKKETYSKQIKAGNFIELPKIGVNAPLILPKKATEYVLEKSLKKGVSFYPKSDAIGENGGVSIILGHSAPPNWPKINYDTVFTKLSEINNGDNLIVYLKGKKYVYKAIGRKKILSGDELSLYNFPREKNKSYLILMTCWPPGQNIRRLEVIFSLDKSF